MNQSFLAVYHGNMGEQQKWNSWHIVPSNSMPNQPPDNIYTFQQMCTLLRKEFSLWFSTPPPAHLRRNIWILSKLLNLVTLKIDVAL